MPARRLLFLDASRLTAHHWHSGHLTGEGAFAADEAGLAAFGEYLARHRGSIFYLLADVAEEGFQLEDVPFVQGRDRIALIKRKLGQYFYGTPLAVALSLGRAKEGRRDEKMLFAALTRPQHFEAWLAALRQAESQLAGIYSVPQTLPALAKEPAKAHHQLLLVTVSHGGLRQSFLQDGRLHFSRLTPLATDTTDEMAIAANIESGKMFHYLAGQRLIARGAPLPTLILAHPSQQAAFRARCLDTDELRFEYLDTGGESHRHGLKSAPTDSHAEALFLHLLVTALPERQFAPSAERRFFRLWQARFALTSAGLVVLAGCLLFAAKQAVDYFGITGRVAGMQAQMEGDQRRYESAMQALPKIPLTTENLRALIGRYDEVAKRAVGPEPLYVLLSRALRDAPKVDIDKLDWRIANSPDEGAPGAAGKAPPAALASQAQGGPYAVVDVYGVLPVSMVTDHRAQLETVNGFADRLRAEAGVQVKVLSMPFEIESGKSLKSGGEATAAAEAPKFSLRVVRKL